ncbi:YciK family oxidoreductase [Endozoicomonas sp. SM1973]|uniref:YciK family oxidoreductase n=1 Tax=Spartinivicinus marinus TaxID=2994442 RepID=A0A853I7C5_9GAMM|nr:YciK family oxidoreductase [Spartinivicinus marinus]MCX4028779.1 YciK family oxidoreductase [Spartinivicinus marinus]NYZ67592.1 YciK family oxidoreductase [Spartinivicinus marinus]
MFDYQAPENLLKDRIILVTGAGDGIGKAAAISFAKHGATVILLGRTTKKLEEVYDQIEASSGPQPAIYPMNLEGASPKDYDDLASTIEKEFGRLDGLLHNASLLGNLSPLSQYDIETWYKVMQVNLNAPFLMTQALLPLLHKSSDASVVFTSSSVGRKGRAHWGAYAISKFATEGMMQTLADEEEGIGPVRVNTINPGATRTHMRAQAYPAENPEQLPAPEEIMNVYLYLLGSDSQKVTGQAFDAQ